MRGRSKNEVELVKKLWNFRLSFVLEVINIVDVGYSWYIHERNFINSSILFLSR